ncbi:hypothetical protein Plhal304r1_c019g0066401 [Plasmopara halstedii]
MYTFAFVYQTVKLEATSEENVKDMTSHNIPAKASASQKSMRQGLIMLKILMTLPVLFALLRFTGVSGGPLGYGICQSGCNALAAACYAAADGVFGVASIPGCNSALGTCMASCVAAGLIPTP